MLSKGKVKYIHSLEMKKYRNELNAFVAEGNKLVADMMFDFECELILAKPSWMAMQGNIPAKELLEAEGDDIRKASFLKTRRMYLPCSSARTGRSTKPILLPRSF